jgi:hypothetical protein
MIWVCYYNGVGNWGFCTRTPLSDVKRIDELAEDTCRHGGPDANIPHSMTGEANVLNYDCKRGHMVREPYAQHFNADGWMIPKANAYFALRLCCLKRGRSSTATRRF